MANQTMQHNKNVVGEETLQHDKDVLRPLATEIAEIAELPHQEEIREKWRALNDLKSVRPMVRIFQLPWREMDVNDELKLQCKDQQARKLESDFRRTLYQWKHMRYDMLVEPKVTVPYVIHHSGFGLKREMEEIPHDEKGGVTSKHFECQISNEEDIEKIKFPTLTFDEQATKEHVEYTEELLDGVLQVVPQRRGKLSYPLWDYLAMWCNPEQVLMDLAFRPDFVHALVERLTSAVMYELDQLEEKNLLAKASSNVGVGEGGFAFNSELPDEGTALRLKDRWGGSMAQIFSEVSPEMHEEFSLAYEKRILNRFGLNYYGCCEPLDRKVEVLIRNLPKLRKVSMSPWVSPQRGATALAGRCVYSAKPNPAFLATKGDWDRESAEHELRNILDATEGKNVEFNLKDVSTVRFEPHRVWEWCDMAMKLVREYE